MAKESFHVAIIGGGLCGVSLAIALTKRNISYTIYESRASFSEIGAGINLAPNSLQAFNLIDPSLRDSIFALATRNQPGDEDVWMNVRLGAPTAQFPDGKLLTKIKAPPTGNTAVGRNELLQLLAGRTAENSARFNKKVVDYSQDENGVTLMFSDGSQERASVAIACDGVHSAVRRKMFSSPQDGGKPPATARPQFTGHCCFRAVFPVAKHIECVGAGNALSSHVYVGPSGYMINYPINGGRDVNINIWSSKIRSGWEDDKAWVIPHQKAEALKEFRGWGPMVQKILEGLDDETSMWAVHYHGASTPKSYFDGRIVLVGDAAHSMGPHQGQGAAQSMEDACVMAEVLALVEDSQCGKGTSLSKRVEAAFRAYESVRRERFERVMITSQEAFGWWSGLWKQDLAQEDLDNFQREAYDRFRWIWGIDVAAEDERAKSEMRSLLADS